MVLQSASPSSNIYLSRRTSLLYLLLYCCVNIMTKATRVRKGFFCLTIHHRRLSFRKVKSRAEAETIKKSCLPAYSPGSHSASFPMPFRTICLRVMLSTVGWILHHQSLAKNCLAGQSDRSSFLTEDSFLDTLTMSH